MHNKLEKLLPRYSWLPVATTLVLHMAAYFGTRLLPWRPEYHYMALPLDEKVPFLPGFVIIYVLAYVQWIAGLVLIARESRDRCRLVLRGEIIGKLLCAILFVVFPTSLIRPEVPGTGLSSRLLRRIYLADAPDNLFPSMHCMESWACFRLTAYTSKALKWYRPVSFIFTLLVFASTVCIRQHVLVDIPAGVAVFEIGFLISRFLEKNSSSEMKK